MDPNGFSTDVRELYPTHPGQTNTETTEVSPVIPKTQFRCDGMYRDDTILQNAKKLTITWGKLVSLYSRHMTKPLKLPSLRST